MTELLRKGDTLTSKKDGCVYTIAQVRVREATHELHSYFAIDSQYAGIVVRPEDLHRFTSERKS